MATLVDPGIGTTHVHGTKEKIRRGIEYNEYYADDAYSGDPGPYLATGEAA
jgi:hypothetical protein